MEVRKRRRSDATMTRGSYRRFGSIAVHRSLITLDELKSAILIQIDDDVNGRDHRLLGGILFDQGVITEDQIDDVLAELKKHLP